MGGFDLNLSTRPFPAYRATNIALTVLLAVLAGVSFWQVSSYLRYSSAAAQIRGEESTVRAEAEVLRARIAHLQGRLNRPEAAAKLKEIDYLNAVLARKNFSWTRVFATLEQMIPISVHLTSLRPDVSEDGKALLHIDVRGRSIADVSDFISLMEESTVFENVVASFEEKKEGAPAGGGVDVALTVTYLPQGETR